MKKPASTQVARFRAKILLFYAQNGRHDLPWRKTRDPYRILVSEIMLQQTQVARVLPKYTAWLQKFPDFPTLAKGTRREVLTLWSGLGYNSRALRLWELAKTVVREHDGMLPHDEATLRALPGIGPYTARAIQIFAWNKNVAAIDVNIRRILLHHFPLSSISDGRQKYLTVMNEKRLEGLATKLLPTGKSRVWHNALMDYGALKLTARKSGVASKTKQKSFKRSRRFYRGRIIRLLTAKKKVSLVEVRKLLDDCPFVCSDLLEALEKEGLLTRTKTHIML